MACAVQLCDRQEVSCPINLAQVLKVFEELTASSQTNSRVSSCLEAQQ